MTTEDSAWDSMLNIAEKYQQEYYELLAEWTKYKKEEYKYLKQNIGFALFGPPSESQDPNNSQETNFALDDRSTDNDIDIIDTFHYNPEAERIIKAIFKKICEFGEGGVETNSIYYGIIYNVTFRLRKTSTAIPSSKKDSKAEKHESTAASNSKKDSGDKISEINIQLTPIFKIKRSCSKKTQTKEFNLYEIWYIDINGRVYKSWADYKKNNILPQCTMVLLMGGFYQPNQEYKITEEFSKVWLEILNSPACGTTSRVLEHINTASTVMGVAGLGLSIATCFTPLAPVAVGAAALGGLNGMWTIGRSTQDLIDKRKHEESLTDRRAFSSWLAITGSTIGIAASGGTAVLTRAVEKGRTISPFARTALNSLFVSNVGINGIGIAYQGYCMYEKCNDGGEINTLDVLFLGTHILFFANSVINYQSAGELIKSTQGKVLDRYRASTRSKRLRKAFNRAKRTAATNNTDKASENAEVIQYINKKKLQQLNLNSSNISTGSYVSFEQGKIVVNGIALLDPMKFVELLLLDRRNEEKSERNKFSSNSEGNRYSFDENNHIDMTDKLKDLLLNLLINYNQQRDNKNSYTPDIDKFDKSFQDMKSMDHATDILYFLFKIATALIQRSEIDFQYLDVAVYFLWSYVKRNLRQTCLNLPSSVNNSKAQKKLLEIILALFEEMDEIIEILSPAFSKYLRSLFDDRKF